MKGHLHFGKWHNRRGHPRGFRRLYLEIYLTVAVSLALVALAAGVIFRLAMESTPASQALRMAGVVIMAALPPADAPRPVQQQTLEKLARELRLDLARRFADRVIGMANGTVVYDGSPDGLNDETLTTIYGGKDWLNP